MVSTVLHRWLKIPYALHVGYANRPKRTRATVLLIHGLGGTGASWSEVVEKLPDDVRVVTIDLLGCGESPSPEWAVYNAKTQARSVLATIIKLRITSPVIIVGHSLGSLVAIEIARRYSMLVSSLVLVSPPLYDTAGETPKRFKWRLNLQKDKLLMKFYRAIERHPQDFRKFSTLAMKWRLIRQSDALADGKIDNYMAALEAAIINQNSYDHAHKLRRPVKILRGVFDPFIVHGHLKKLAQINPNIHMSNVMAGHDIRGSLVGAVVNTINEQLPDATIGHDYEPTNRRTAA